MTYRKGVKDAPTPRPNKRPRLVGPERGPVVAAASAAPSKPGSKPMDEKVPSKGDDALTAEFLNVMNPRRKDGPAWADSELETPAVSRNIPRKPPDTAAKPQQAEEQSKAVANDKISDLEWMKSRMADIREGNEFEQSDGEDDPKNVEVVDGSTKVNWGVLLYSTSHLGFSLTACRSFMGLHGSSGGHPTDDSLHCPPLCA